MTYGDLLETSLRALSTADAFRLLDELERPTSPPDYVEREPDPDSAYDDERQRCVDDGTCRALLCDKPDNGSGYCDDHETP